MRLLTWNMAYWKPAGFKTIENRRRQWALLGALGPDVALLQECRPDDLNNLAPTWMRDEYDIVGAIPERWTACSALLARKYFAAERLDVAAVPKPERRWLEYLSGYIAEARISTGLGPIVVASVHTVAKEVIDPAVTDDDHARIRRPALSRAWHNDLAVAALMPLVGDGHFIVGGDWNNAVLFDTNYPAGAEGGPGASGEFFAARQEGGWHHALRKFEPDEVGTYLDPKSAAYELDHVFTDRALHDALTSCAVLAHPPLAELSDHAPLVAELTI